MGRPVGVTILSGVMVAAGAAFAVAGLGFFFVGSTGAAAAARSHTGTAALIAALGAASGVMFLIFALYVWRVGVRHYTSTGS